MPMHVTELAVYPIKSTQQVNLQQARIENTGFSHDRRWVLADNNGRFITQREYPQLVLVLAQPMAQGLLLQTESSASLQVAVPQDGAKTTVSVWKDTCEALDAGDDAAEWFSAFLKKDCRLLYQPEQAIRQVDQRFAQEQDRTGFADGFPFLLTSESSLADLNGRLETPVPMKRFRPNIVINHPDAFAEDNWRVLQIGEVTFRVARPCSRCVMTTVDTDIGEKAGKDPLMTLAKYRRSENGVIFGQNLIHNSGGIIRVGDKVTVIESL